MLFSSECLEVLVSYLFSRKSYLEIKRIQHRSTQPDPVEMSKLLNKEGKHTSSAPVTCLCYLESAHSSFILAHSSWISPRQCSSRVWTWFMPWIPSKRQLQTSTPGWAFFMLQSPPALSHVTLHSQTLLYIFTYLGKTNPTLLSCGIDLSLFQMIWIEKKR